MSDELVERLQSLIEWLEEDPDNIHHLPTDQVAKLRDWLNGKPTPAARIEAQAALIREAGEVGIYIASKTKHGPRWQALRSLGAPIVSTWIDESGKGQTSDWPDLWRRCVHEASCAACLIVYREPGEILKGAWVEVGAALAKGRKVFAVGCEEFSIRHHPGITLCPDFETAYGDARAVLAKLEGRE